MNHLDRLQAILIQLQSKKIVKAQEIADRFDISLRTVYRDIRSLEESGVPIGAEAGVGYYLAENYNLPPIMFTHEEASALIFGEKLTEQMSDARVKRDFESAIIKIKATLRPSEKDLFEKLHNHIAVYNGAKNETTAAEFLYELQHAIANKQVIRMQYKAISRDEATLRDIEPIGLCNYAAHWHLIAWCRLRNSYRNFRIDRIDSLCCLDEFFVDKKHISLDEYMDSTNPSKGEEPNISIAVKKKNSRYMNETKFWYGFIREETVDEETVRYYFSNNELNGFASWILNTGCMALIEKPVALLDIIRQYVRQSALIYLSESEDIKPQQSFNSK